MSVYKTRRQELSEVTFAQRLTEEFLEWRKNFNIFYNFKPTKGCCTQKGSPCLLEMEMMDFNCNKEGGYTLEKLFNFWGILALELSPLNSYGIFPGASF